MKHRRRSRPSHHSIRDTTGNEYLDMARGVPRELVDFEAATDPNAVQNIYGARGAGAIASSVWPRSRPLRLISLIFLLLVASPAIVAVVMTIIAHLQGGGSAPAPPH